MSLTSSDQTTFCFSVGQKSSRDPRSASYLKDAHALGLTAVTEISCFDLYFIQANLSPAELEILAHKVLSDPITQNIEWHKIPPKSNQTNPLETTEKIIEVALRSGVTDPVAGEIVRAALIMDLPPITAASTGQRFLVTGDKLTDSDLHNLARRLLSNPIIQRYALGEITPSFPVNAESSGVCEDIQLRGKSDQQLLQLSTERRAALDLNEMRVIRAYCEKEGRDLTDIEFEMIAQTWSEHCVHKTFKSQVTLSGSQTGVIDNLFNHTIRAATREINAPRVRSAFTDNAGIIEFDGANEISFKVETHNHPSAVEPFGGANTGIGGVIRDIIGVSARPIAATDILCFGPTDTDFSDLPPGVLHPRRIESGVVSGIQDYGNKIGIPTVNGAVIYDPGYTSNPLVFCGCVGIAPKDSNPKNANSGDHIVVLGGRTGRDGLRGATFSSMTMDAQTGETAGASVQIGAPIVEKGLIDVIMLARDQRLYHAITDCGAGGLSSAVGEITSGSDSCSAGGGSVQLERVPLKYPGLAPWEIWLSEAQERMVLAVPPESLAALQTLCDEYEVELTDIGEFNQTGRLTIHYQEDKVLDLDNEFLHKGLPQRKLNADIQPHVYKAGTRRSDPLSNTLDCNQTLLDLLAHPDISSKESIIRVYDHEVQGQTVIKPLAGINQDGPSDACVIRPRETSGSQAFALSAGINQEFGKLDPYQMAVNVIDEALRNLTAVGADPAQTAILDNFCWGDPLNPGTMGDLVQATLGCRDGAIAYQTPFISGKDSFNNEYIGVDGLRHAIPPTLLISAVGILKDWKNSVTMDLKKSGSRVYLVGRFEPTLGGSHFNLIQDEKIMEGIPDCNPTLALRHYKALHAAMSEGLVLACHDLSEGGLAVSAAEMCIGGRLGMQLTLPSEDVVHNLFGETTGCLLVEVSENEAQAFESHFSGLHCQFLGLTTREPVLEINQSGMARMKLPVTALLRSWRPDSPISNEGDIQ